MGTDRLTNVPLPRRRKARLIFAGLGVSFLIILGVRVGAGNGHSAATGAVEFPRNNAWWTDFQATLAKEVEDADHKEGMGVIFYGDSITEFQRGTSAGSARDELSPAKEIFEATYSRYNAAALAISGDQVPHLAWRLKHGELPSTKAPRVVVLLIGTNDLGAARHQVLQRADRDARATLLAARMKEGRKEKLENREDEEVNAAELAAAKADIVALELPRALATAAQQVVVGVRAIVQKLRATYPGTAIVIQALLPRGDVGLNNERIVKQPSSYASFLQGINAGFRAVAGSIGNVHYIDCGDRLLTPEGDIDAARMPDVLHPSSEGYAALASCLEPLVGGLYNETLTKGLQVMDNGKA